MNGRYAVLASSIHQDASELERVVERVERAMLMRRADADAADLFLDAAALNLHDFSSGLERLFAHIASDVDQSVPSGSDWHRQLLRPMTVDVPGLRPRVFTRSTPRSSLSRRSWKGSRATVDRREAPSPRRP